MQGLFTETVTTSWVCQVVARRGSGPQLKTTAGAARGSFLISLWASWRTGGPEWPALQDLLLAHPAVPSAGGEEVPCPGLSFANVATLHQPMQSRVKAERLGWGLTPNSGLRTP